MAPNRMQLQNMCKKSMNLSKSTPKGGGIWCDILEISTQNFCKRCILYDYIYISIIQCICIYVPGRSRNNGGKIRGLG